MEYDSLDYIRVGIASPDEIRKWSHGVVKKAETINYRTLKPESGGLFCERIFGPEKDWECHCGKYKKIKYRGIVCDRCGVEVTRSKVRRERMGHIELATPVCHIWYLKAVPSPISLLLDIPSPSVEKVIYFALYIVTHVDKAKINKNWEAIKEAVQTEVHEIEENKEKNIRDIEKSFMEELEAYGGEDEQVIRKLKKDVEEKKKLEEKSASDRIKEILNSLELLQKVDKKSLMTENEYRSLQRLMDTISRKLGRGFEHLFGAGSGSASIRDLLKEMDEDTIERTYRDLKKEIAESKGPKRAKAIKRLEVVEAFRKSKSRPEWMILEVLPVIPPDLRPMVQLDGGRFASSDLNDLYRRIINRNNRLKKIMEINAPECIVSYEKRLLQESVDALIDNSRRRRPVTSTNNRPLRSLSDILRGKEGMFRRNLLGKRVDYSGRSVIVVGPKLKLHQCGVPKEMALELFKPFVMGRLVEQGYTTNIKTARRMIEKGKPEVWDVLEEVVKDYPVLLNRAPTLHRVSIQAFEPILVDSKAIQIHPLVCPPFNADFDGDQMAVHIPLSAAAQVEAALLMLSTNNILSPAHGRPLVSPKYDVVLGAYYLTQKRVGARGCDKLFSTPDDAILAYEKGLVDLHADIRVKLDTSWEDRKGNLRQRVEDIASVIEDESLADELRALSAIVKEKVERAEDVEIAIKGLKKLTKGYFDREELLRRLEELEHDLKCIAKGTYFVTTVGRVIFNQLLPLDLRFIDSVIDIDELSEVVSWCFKKHGIAKTTELLDDIKDIGFKFATRSGISISVTDLDIPSKRDQILEDTERRVKEIDRDYRRGIITIGERQQLISDEWTEAANEVADDILNRIDPFNPIYMMVNSGARGTTRQISQMAGMRGLMTDPFGRLIEDLPIKSNFHEGLSVLEYFISTHGGRKGLADTALRTADAGYLTRKLVDVAQDVIVREEDCGTSTGIVVSAIMRGGEIVESLNERLMGRFAAEDVINAENDEIIVKADEEINEETAELIENLGIEQVRIRSPLTCELSRGICAKCYGRDLATGKLVEVGEAVGIVAAQSIGEPGTQLTLKTFHTGGVAQQYLTGVAEVKRKRQEASREFYEDRRTGLVAFDVEKMGREKSKSIQAVFKVLEESVRGLLRVVELFEARRPKGEAIVTDLDGVVAEVEQKELRLAIHTEQPLLQELEQLPEGEGLKLEVNRKILGNTVLKDVVDPENGEVILQEGEEITSKVIDQIVGKYLLDNVGANKNMRGGEVKIKAGEALTAKTIEKLKELGLDKVKVAKSYLVPHRGNLPVKPGTRVSAGDRLTWGPLNPQRVLELKGPSGLQDYLIREIQSVYKSQGLDINDKHIEIIVKQMLRKRRVKDSSDTDFLPGQVVDKFEFESENERIRKEGGKEATADWLLLGVTEAALSSESFLSRASFQKTAKVLTESAIKGRVDHLVGLKENVILGRLIPAGTGFALHNDIKVTSPDEELEAKEPELISEEMVQVKQEEVGEGES